LTSFTVDIVKVWKCIKNILILKLQIRKVDQLIVWMDQRLVLPDQNSSIESGDSSFFILLWYSGTLSLLQSFLT